MALRLRLQAVTALALLALAATPANATDGPLLLFGGRDHGEFLGCLNCYRSESFSVWNESGEFGNPANEKSIWNRGGPYGSPRSPLSPWNPRGSSPPLVVDRIGNLYGYFTLNRSYPKRVRLNEAHHKWADFEWLVWLLDNYEYVVAHLEELRARF